MYSKALLHGDTIKCTACEAKTKLCKITNIHMMSSVGRSANPDEIHAIQITVRTRGSWGGRGLLLLFFVEISLSAPHVSREKWETSILSQRFLLYICIQALQSSKHFSFLLPFLNLPGYNMVMIWQEDVIIIFCLYHLFSKNLWNETLHR